MQEIYIVKNIFWLKNEMLSKINNNNKTNKYYLKKYRNNK